MEQTYYYRTPQQEFEEVVIPGVRKALERGALRKDMWLEKMEYDYVDRAQHLINIHVDTRLSEVIQFLDYGDVENAKNALFSAIGYLAVLAAELELPEGTAWKSAEDEWVFPDVEEDD